MPDKKLQLQYKIPESDVKLGAGQKSGNKIVVRLVNDGNENLQLPAFGEGTLFLTASIGTQATDLVATPEKPGDVNAVPPATCNQYPKEFSLSRLTWSCPI